MKLRIALLGFLGVYGALAGAATFSPPPPLDKDTLPALIYSESEYGKAAVNVYLATRKEDKWVRETLVSAPFVAVEQVDETKFLIAAGPTETESELYITDLMAGTSILVTTRKGPCPIAFPRPHERYFRWRESYKAFLIQDSEGAPDVEFITVDYGKMTVTSENISKSLLGGKFGPDTHLKIGPNGAHLAYMALLKSQEGAPRAMVYQMNVYHFTDKSLSVAAPNVVVQVSENAPVPFGVPPFEWWDWENVLWGEIDPATQGNEANITFFRNDVHKDLITPLFSQRIALTESGGELFRESPLVKEIRYRPHGTTDEEYTLNFETNSLDPFKDPAHVRILNNAGDVQVSTPTRLLFHKDHFGTRVLDATSPRSRYVAYSLSTGPEVADAERKSELFVNLEEQDAEKVAGPVYYCRPLGWIEPPVNTEIPPATPITTTP